MRGRPPPSPAGQGDPRQRETQSGRADMADSEPMKPADLLPSAGDDARLLLAAAQAGWERTLPDCPGWDAADLVRHQGGIFVWMAAVVTSGERVSRRALDPAPADAADLPGWYLASLDQTLDVLGSADPESPTWTFSSRGDLRVGWWQRRLAVEVAIHRWDAEHAAAADGGSGPDPLDGDVAAAGIEEFMTEFLPGLLGQDGVDGPSGTLHLHATDGPAEWWIDLDAAGPAVSRHAKADTAIRGTRSDLLLWLNNRGSPGALEILGPQKVLDEWKQLRR
jgi:uncharacterized protein (TIGR03083 family)